MTPESLVELTALGLALYAGWRGLPRTPRLPWADVYQTAVLFQRGDPAAVAQAASLGSDGEIAPVTGMGLSWPDVAQWSEGLQAALHRRLHGVVAADLGSGRAATLASQVPGLRSGSVDVHALVADDGGLDLARAQRLMDLLVAPSDRLILVLGPGEVAPALQSLHAAPGLRDRLVALVSWGGGAGEVSWLGAHFDHDQLDTELNRATPYICLGAPPSAADAPRFPEPPLPKHGRRTVDAIDLSSVDLSTDDPVLTARALWVVLAFRLAG
jgi:hypothetical protein